METGDLTGKTPLEILRWAAEKYGHRAAMASSFGMEDMVLLHMISTLPRPIDVFTIDTGRLHEETYETMEKARAKYNINIRVYFPQHQAVEELTRAKGLFSFRENLENRKECCHLRKVEPLQRALTDLDAWITGLRREQSVTRAGMQLVEKDAQNPRLTKINPLLEWTAAQVEEYIAQHRVPVNPLHGKNYPSIGCAPCTRPILPGEDPRAGRWWWEHPDHKECGLHRPR